MRSLARLTLTPPAPPPLDVWAVRTVEHLAALRLAHDALTCVADALRLGGLNAVPDSALLSLGSALDAVVSASAGGGTRCIVPPDEAQRLHLRADLAKRLLGQLRALSRCARHERDVWADRVASTLGEAMGPTP